MSQSVKTFRREIKPPVNECCDTLGRIVTSRCNDAVVNINSTEKFHRLSPEADPEGGEGGSSPGQILNP